MKTYQTEYGTYNGNHPKVFLLKCLIKNIIYILVYPITYTYYILRFNNIWNLKAYLKDHNKDGGLLYSFYLKYFNKRSSFVGVNSTFKDIPCFPHGLYGIFISNNASIGKKCVIFQGVTIGANTVDGTKNFGSPTIKDEVYIGAGATIIGNITVGNNVRIGANAICYEDIPDNSVVVQEKTRIIKRTKKMDNRYIIKGKKDNFYYENGNYIKMENKNEKE